MAVCLLTALIQTLSSSLILTTTPALRTNKWKGLISVSSAKHHRLTFTEHGSGWRTWAPEGHRAGCLPTGRSLIDVSAQGGELEQISSVITHIISKQPSLLAFIPEAGDGQTSEAFNSSLYFWYSSVSHLTVFRRRWRKAAVRGHPDLNLQQLWRSLFSSLNKLSRIKTKTQHTNKYRNMQEVTELTSDLLALNLFKGTLHYKSTQGMNWWKINGHNFKEKKNMRDKNVLQSVKRPEAGNWTGLKCRNPEQRQM